MEDQSRDESLDSRTPYDRGVMKRPPQGIRSSSTWIRIAFAKASVDQATIKPERSSRVGRRPPLRAALVDVNASISGVRAKVRGEQVEISVLQGTQLRDSPTLDRVDQPDGTIVPHRREAR